MGKARIAIAVIGILLPYVVRIPRGSEWVQQYTDMGIGGFLFFGAFNAVAWGSLLAYTFLIQRPVWLLIPGLFGFGFLGWAHSIVDLGSDAQASFALIFIPLWAVVAIALTGALAYVLESRANSSANGR
jgi:hypothetical protein